MKNAIMMLAAVGLLAVACNEKSKGESAKEVTRSSENGEIIFEVDSSCTGDSGQKSAIRKEKVELLSTESYASKTKADFMVVCSDARKTESERRHSVDENLFMTYAQAHSSNPSTGEPNYVSCEWKDIFNVDPDPEGNNDENGFFQRYLLSCYDGFFGVEITSGGSLKFIRYNYFSCYKSMFPAVMFEGIDLKLRQEGATSPRVSFTKAIMLVLMNGKEVPRERIIFKLTYTTSAGEQTEYYDMSDYPG